MTAELERIVNISAAFDRRDPNPAKNYGIHRCELKMVVKGTLGAVQFVLSTNWQLPHVQEELDARPERGRYTHLTCHPQPFDLGYHSPTPRHEGQKPMEGYCQYVEGGTCYYDGSSLAADSVYEVLLREGSDGVWKLLEDRYRELFSEGAA